ncbi:MAG TPA: ImmA/IrrE family metallo-endopeptidase [Vicinamibacterales bacterium]|nr:ImmA/IrrE family metallo-endopeptidase [Vicinamibacterales bacterium]
MRVDVRPELLRWARERAGKDVRTLIRRFPQLASWEEATSRPTLKQLERFARATYTPVGYFFLPAPPDEPVPIPDFRTIGDAGQPRPSADLLDTIYVCQQRQEWYRDFAQVEGASPLAFVGSATLDSDVIGTAAQIRATLGFSVEERQTLPSWTEALRRFIGQAETSGLLVMVSGVVGTNTNRKLNPDEFRGFALADRYAPVVFINGADTKAAQLFTLAHEIAHIWLGQTALSDVGPAAAPAHRVERWCNEVAAEILVPMELFRAVYNPDADPRDEAQRLARRFKVSTLVVIRRMRDAGGLSMDEFWEIFKAERERLLALPRSDGGDFYVTQPARLSKRFARAIITSTLEGQTLHRDAFRLLGCSRMATFREVAQVLGSG